MNVIGFVPARGGSRGIPGKNVRKLCGRPLVWWCLRALQECGGVDRVVLATEAPDIAACALSLGMDKLEIYRRSERSATDTAPTEDVLLEFLAAQEVADEDVVVLAQATNPFLRPRDVEEAISRIVSGSCDSVVSCAPWKRFLWDGRGRPLNYDPAHRPRRQDFDGALVENGAFYAARAGDVRRAGHRLPGVVHPVVMPEYTAVELDEEDDWLVAESLLRRHALALVGPGRPIRMFLTDVDGVLTDGGMYYGESGEELKRFHTMDGKGIELLRERGVITGIITGERTELVVRRARKLGIDHLWQGVRDKLAVARALCDALSVDLEEVAYVGDDVGDVELLDAVGFSACPSTANPIVRRRVDWVCERPGGGGCVREVAELVLESLRSSPETPADAKAHEVARSLAQG